jgi:hypothetical protein
MGQPDSFYLIAAVTFLPSKWHNYALDDEEAYLELVC